MDKTIKTTSFNEPHDLFLNALRDFRNKIGNKDFWKDEKQQDIAVEALTQDYLRTNHDGTLEEDAIALQSILMEYELRKDLMRKLANQRARAQSSEVG